jgi:hypothetical protein
MPISNCVQIVKSTSLSLTYRRLTRLKMIFSRHGNSLTLFDLIFWIFAHKHYWLDAVQPCYREHPIDNYHLGKNKATEWPFYAVRLIIGKCHLFGSVWNRSSLELKSSNFAAPQPVSFIDLVVANPSQILFWDFIGWNNGHDSARCSLDMLRKLRELNEYFNRSHLKLLFSEYQVPLSR